MSSVMSLYAFGGWYQKQRVVWHSDGRIRADLSYIPKRMISVAKSTQNNYASPITRDIGTINH
jgi:hypothetical protein